MVILPKLVIYTILEYIDNKCEECIINNKIEKCDSCFKDICMIKCDKYFMCNRCNYIYCYECDMDNKCDRCEYIYCNKCIDNIYYNIDISIKWNSYCYDCSKLKNT